MSTSRVISSPIGPAGPTGPAGPVNLYQGTASGTATYTTTASPTPSAYTANDLYVVTFTTGNTGASTLNANGLGAKNIFWRNTALVGGEILAGESYLLKYDGTQFQVEGPSSTQKKYYANSTSGSATYTATLAPVPTTYENGAQYSVVITTTNSGASTLNFNGLGAKSITLNGAAVTIGQLQAGTTYQFMYDGTNLAVLGQAIASNLPPGLNGQALTYDSTVAGLARFSNVVMDLRYGVFDQDDFVQGIRIPTSSSTLGYSAIPFYKTLSDIVSSGGSLSSTLASGHPGVVTLSTGISSSSSALRLFGAHNGSSTTGASGMLQLGYGEVEVIWWFRIPVLSTGTQRFSVNAGLTNTNVANAFVDNITFNYLDSRNSGKSSIDVIVAGGADIFTSGVTTILANTWYRARLVVDAARTKVDMYIKEGSSAEVLDCTYTGSLPSTLVVLGPAFTVSKQVGTGNIDVDVDGWQYTVRLTTQR